MFSDCKNMHKKPYIQIAPNFVEVHFERTMSRAELDKLKVDLAAVNVKIVYTDMKYDGDLLNFLSFTVEHNGQVGSSSSYFTQHNPWGFLIDSRNGQTARLLVGEIVKQ